MALAKEASYASAHGPLRCRRGAGCRIPVPACRRIHARLGVRDSAAAAGGSRGGIWIPVEGGAREPIGSRIVETPENPERTEILRDPRSGFIAYAPVGSVRKGEALVRRGGGKTIECGTCHGADLKGLGPVPGIAGRSPSYLVRQMYDMQAGARHGEWADLMKPVVARLDNDDLVNIAAYVSSLMPLPSTSSAAADGR